MKKISILLLATFTSYFSYSQYVYTIKADSVKLTNDSCNTELIIENSTRNVPGFLYNKGNGRTEFRRVLNPIGTNKYLVGNDTLDLSGIISSTTTPTLQQSFDAAPTASPQINAHANIFSLDSLGAFNADVHGLGEALGIRSFIHLSPDENGYQMLDTSGNQTVISQILNDFLGSSTRMFSSNLNHYQELDVGANVIEFGGNAVPGTGYSNVLFTNLPTLLSPLPYIAAFDGDTLKKVAYPVITSPNLQQVLTSGNSAANSAVFFAPDFHSFISINPSYQNSSISLYDFGSNRNFAIEPSILRFYDAGMGNVKDILPGTFTKTTRFTYPNPVSNDVYFPISVNGNYADSFGNINISSGGGASWGSITGTLSNQTDLQSALNLKQNNINLTTTGTSGAASLVGNNLNIPNYTSGSSYTASNGLTMSGNDVQLGGTLSSATTITGGNNTLSINGTNGNSNGVVSVLNNGSSPAIRGESNASNNSAIIGISTGSNGAGVTGNALSSTSVAVNGTNASSGIGGKFYSASGLPIWGILNSGTPNGVNTLLSIGKGGVNGSNANGEGGSIDFSLADNSSLKLSNQLVSTISDINNFTTEFSITGKWGNAQLTLFTLSGNGSTKLNRYGFGSFTGTPTYNLSTTSNGNIIETPIPIYGTATLSSGTITVSTTLVKTGAKIFVSVNTPSGTRGFLSAPTGSIVNGTSFVINSTSSTDASTINWQIIN